MAVASFFTHTRRTRAITSPSDAYIAITLARRSFAALNQRQRAREAIKNLARGNVLLYHTSPICNMISSSLKRFRNAEIILQLLDSERCQLLT